MGKVANERFPDKFSVIEESRLYISEVDLLSWPLSLIEHCIHFRIVGIVAFPFHSLPLKSFCTCVIAFFCPCNISNCHLNVFLYSRDFTAAWLNWHLIKQTACICIRIAFGEHAKWLRPKAVHVGFLLPDAAWRCLTVAFVSEEVNTILLKLWEKVDIIFHVTDATIQNSQHLSLS